MELDPSEADQSLKQKAEALHRLATGPLSSSLNKLSGSSRGIPSAQDFHYYYNFNEFKAPIKEITEKSKSILEVIGSSEQLSGRKVQIQDDLDEAYESLVNLNDDLYERVDAAVDEFKEARKKEEETGVRMMDSEEGFQLVLGKNKKKKREGLIVKDAREDDSSGSVKVVTRDMNASEIKAKVPFHIPSVPRPQEEYKIVVNNSNQPFYHVWLQSSEDSSIYKHPLEAFSYEDFVDKDIEHLEPVKPLSLEDTPFKFVETVNDLKILAAKLRSVNEFAVDLEHNHYRSFQGLTCLMQISTRAEDFIVDTLKLRIHIGPHLREVFKDPTKRKVIHGSDRDILWLQRDFGIYICNMFDTGQASRVLKLERNSLEYLLAHLCEVTANKEYQNAEWRLRPLPIEMIKYAREDTHYLLYMYDILRIRLWSSKSDQLDVADPLAEVYKRSYDLCMQLYEKELLTEDSYLQIYGLQNAGFNAQQLAIVAGLCEWRDFIARAEDESTGYILPNKALLEIAKHMPTTARTLRHTVRSKYVNQNLGALVSIIKRSIENASAFEAAVEYLKEKQFAMQARQNIDLMDDSQTPPAECVSPTTETLGNHDISESSPITDHSSGFFSIDISATDTGKSEQGSSSMQNKQDETVIKSVEEAQFNPILQSATRAIVEVQKKPSRGFGAMFGNSSTKKKLDSHKKETELKLQQIRSLMTTPSHTFPTQTQQTQLPLLLEPSTTSKIKESIHLDGKMTPEEPEAREPIVEEHAKKKGEDNKKSQDDILYFCSESDNEETEQSKEQRKSGEIMSLADLSSSFEKCFESLNQKENPKQGEKSTKSTFLTKVKPFDYEVARKEFQIGNKTEEGSEQNDERNKKKKKNPKVDREVEFAQGRRRQVFPMTGNRNSTFRK